MGSSSEPAAEFGAIDFNAVYLGRQLLPGADAPGVPWDIGEAQPVVVELEREGRFHGQVLDVGCGLGANSAFLASRGYQVTGIDAAPAAIEEARRRTRGLGVEFQVADATGLAGHDGRFDTVLDSALYHHIPESARPGYAAALRRAAAPGARLNLLCFADVPDGMPEPVTVSQASVRACLTGAGWVVTEVRRASFFGLTPLARPLLEELGVPPGVDSQRWVPLPIWVVLADRG